MELIGWSKTLLAMLPKGQDFPKKKSNYHAFFGAVFLCFEVFCDLHPSFSVIIQTALTNWKMMWDPKEQKEMEKKKTTRLDIKHKKGYLAFYLLKFFASGRRHVYVRLITIYIYFRRCHKSFKFQVIFNRINLHNGGENNFRFVTEVDAHQY